MRRKFNTGDFVVVNRRATNPTLSKWLKYSPLGVGTILDIGHGGNDRVIYCLKEEGNNGESEFFYSWELDLVSRNEKKV